MPLDFLDQLLRRNSRLPRLPWLRRALRRPYYRLVDPLSRGLPLHIGGVIPVRLPAEYCAKEQEAYEAPVVAKLADWVAAHPEGTVVDIGCSFGYFSCASLFASPTLNVVAIDGDLSSLKATLRVCHHASDVSSRLSLLHCLVGPETSPNQTVPDILSKTKRDLEKVSGDPGTTSYVNLDSEYSETELPRIMVDTICRFVTDDVETGSMLIKCDVEGAEQLVLEGARKTLAEIQPDLLLSVHSPEYLERFGGSENEIRDLLTSSGYGIEVFAIDHESHWLCRPNRD